MAEKEVCREVLSECVDYFKERSVYKKLFGKVCEKYHSLGHLGGSVTLTGLTPEEKRQLSGFFQKDFTENKSVTISVKLMEKALFGSKFYMLGWIEILEAYYEESLSTKKELQQQREYAKRDFFQKLLEKHQGSPGAKWLEQCLKEKQEGYQLLMLHYKERCKELRDTLEILFLAFQKLPIVLQEQQNEEKIQKTALPVFAAQVSGNPHFLDNGTLAEKLLILFLKDYLKVAYSSKYHSLEEKNQLLYDAGLLRDDLSNYTLTYGLVAEDLSGAVHKGIQGFLERKEPVQLTLLTVSRLAKVYPKTGRKVYIVENPAVFSALTESVPDIAMICGNGQIRVATLALMDLFEKDVEFWYAGDFDPEGLMIAQRLRKRFGIRLHFWNYKKCYYEQYLSKVRLDNQRKKKLDRIDEEELLEIKNAIQSSGYATYQEMLIPEYIKELLGVTKKKKYGLGKEDLWEFI